VGLKLFHLLATKVCPVDPLAHVTPSVVKVSEFCVITSLLVQHDLNECHPLRSMSIIMFQYNNLPMVKKLRNRTKRGQFTCKLPLVLITGEGKKIATLFKTLVVTKCN
jgi:hypothetical protein